MLFLSLFLVVMKWYEISESQETGKSEVRSDFLLPKRLGIFMRVSLNYHMYTNHNLLEPSVLVYPDDRSNNGEQERNLPQEYTQLGLVNSVYVLEDVFIDSLAMPKTKSNMKLRVRILTRRSDKFMSSLGPEGENFPLLVKDYFGHQQISASNDAATLHIMIVSADRKREAAFYFRVRGLKIWVLQGTCCQHSFLRIVESDGKKFVPVADQVFLHNYLMKS